jgi:hypothetical protein
MPDDTKPLRAVLRQAIAASRMGKREIEVALGVGHGKLDRILDGTLELRVRHVLALARVLEVSPKDFLDLAYPEPPGGARYSLRDWLGPRQAGPQSTSNKTEAANLREVVREVVREELAHNASAGQPDIAEILRTLVREELKAPTSKASR